MPSYGYISANLAKAVTMPGAPWQKCTNLIFLELLLVAKFPLIRCLTRKTIEAFMRLMIGIVSAPKSFCLREISKMLRFPPRPCAPPRYYFL